MLINSPLPLTRGCSHAYLQLILSLFNSSYSNITGVVTVLLNSIHLKVSLGILYLSFCNHALLGVHNNLYQQTLYSYDHALAPGTAVNKTRQAKVYLAFAVSYQVNYLRPSVIAAAMYTQFLANSYKAPATIKNYLSGARSWIVNHGGIDSAFASYEAHAVLKHNMNKSNHQPVQAFPLKLLHIRHIYVCLSMLTL